MINIILYGGPLDGKEVKVPLDCRHIVIDGNQTSQIWYLCNYMLEPDMTELPTLSYPIVYTRWGGYRFVCRHQTAEA